MQCRMSGGPTMPRSLDVEEELVANGLPEGKSTTWKGLLVEGNLGLFSGVGRVTEKSTSLHCSSESSAGHSGEVWFSL